uniref:EOG090X03AK n=1 Tax=Evadne anonyx TaxID=141404 RepID=A0A9N6WPT6_9CRUS|nr:EOG090X03AK [Evadne anonyx]
MQVIEPYQIAREWMAIEIVGVESKDCDIPFVVRGTWFHRENGEYFTTEINGDSMSDRGTCLYSHNSHHVNYTFVFKDPQTTCYHCVNFFVRTVNILDKVESGCVALRDQSPSLNSICDGINPDQQLVTMFAENFVPVNCRSGLEGVWQFAYQNRFRFTGECNHPGAVIQSCQTPGSQFLITNQKFTITYKKCEGMSESLDGTTEYSCLGDWFIGKNHFFAVANTKESRKDEKFRCFLKNRDDDAYIGKSITPECNTLKSPEDSPERYRMTPVKSETVTPGCNLPQNFSGHWINTANIDADVYINQTHIVETWHPDVGRSRRTVYICKESRDSRILLTRLNVDGCQKDYICFDIVPRHQNIIRYRKGLAMIKDNFHTVCSWTQFPAKNAWKYDLLLARDPVPIRCPVAGKFKFQQQGDIQFETRILGGVTDSPRPDVYCKQNVSDFSVCDTEQKEIWIKENYCLSVDYKGRPVDIYSDPDYKLKCIGFWKENLRSYLITYDELDAFSKYRCWVYQRADLTRIYMSQALGPYCPLNQDVTSWNYTEGAAVHLNMEEYERERDQCPMNFDDGSDPWSTSETYITTFGFGSFRSGTVVTQLSITAMNYLVQLFEVLVEDPVFYPVDDM